jgi:NADPH-dependent 2,4-dienoyl-CoA reductase/sulfur reductase-like enzyme
MPNYQYLIIGGGMTAAAAVDGIREVDSTGGIGLISAEPDPPYNRPPLSKALWKGERLETIWRKAKNELMEIHLCRVVKEIVPTQKRVLDDKGTVLPTKNFCWPPAAGHDAFRSAMTRSFTSVPCRITDVFAHSPKRAGGLP